MAKQDVLDAINATIIENGQKGITAQSLNNVLTMMAENAGEGGSGDGALRIIVPDMMVIGPEIIAMGELSPASWEEIKSLLEQSGIDPSEYDAAVKASFEHNANVAQQIIEKGKARQGISVVLDQTPYSPAILNFILHTDPELAEYIEKYAICGVQPAGLHMQYMKVTPEGEAMVVGGEFMCVLAPSGNIYLDGMDMTYPSNMLIYLNLDGSLTFTPIEEEQPSSGSGVVTFYAAMDGDLSSEYKAKNVETFGGYKEGAVVTICAIANGAVVATFMCTQSSHHTNMISASCVQIVENTPSGIIFLCYEDGSVLIQQ